MSRQRGFRFDTRYRRYRRKMLILDPLWNTRARWKWFLRFIEKGS